MNSGEMYAPIDGEREYRERIWPGQYRLYMQHYLGIALARVSAKDGEAGSLENLRKIAALAVAACEVGGLENLQKIAALAVAASIPQGSDYENGV